MQIIEVKLTSYKGLLDKIEGEEAVRLRSALPNFDDDRFLFIRYIDPYDDTLFNSFQMAPLIHELDILLQDFPSGVDRDVLEHLRLMALRCQEEHGQHLRFVGD